MFDFFEKTLRDAAGTATFLARPALGPHFLSFFNEIAVCWEKGKGKKSFYVTDIFHRQLSFT